LCDVSDTGFGQEIIQRGYNSEDVLISYRGGPRNTLAGEPMIGDQPATTDLNETDETAQTNAPVLSDFAVSSSKTSPIVIKFSVRMKSGKAKISLGKKAGMWFCFGRPSTIVMRDYLDEQLNQLNPSVADDGQAVVLLDVAGPGFVAASCYHLKPDPDRPGVWTGSIEPGLKVEDGEIEIPSAFGSDYFNAAEMPVSLILWDDDYQISNELKAVVNLKTGKIVEDADNEHSHKEPPQ
jgi:hypothetical protein